MVTIDEIKNDNDTDSLSPSQERLLDAEEIEQVAATLKRPTARMQLESLAKKLRKESAALKVVETQGHSAATNGDTVNTPATTTTTTTTAPQPRVVAAPTPLSTSNATHSGTMYTTVDKFAFDAGGYNEKFVTLYISLPGVGEIPKENITCAFQKDALDLIVRDLHGKSYRLKKDNLEHDIDVEKSKYVVKADKIIVKLAKIKGEYGSYDYWSKLTDPKRREKALNKSKNDPSASITELMKDMYESGDDKMRKMIGETMLKQQRGELGKGGPGMGLDDMDSSDDF